MRTEQVFNECVSMVAALVAAKYEIYLPKENLSILLKAATKVFLFQPEWCGIEWSCRCINDMYWRFSFRKAGSDDHFVTIYCNWELNGNISIEML